MAEFNKIQNEIVILNVGGIKFTTSLKTFQAEPKSLLGVMFSGRHPLVKQEDGSIFIDRDGTHFRIILNYLRGNILSIQQLPEDNFILSDLLSEAQYYQLVGFSKILEPTEEEQTVINQSEILKPTEEFDFNSLISMRNLKNLTFLSEFQQEISDLEVAA